MNKVGKIYKDRILNGRHSLTGNVSKDKSKIRYQTLKC